MSVPPESTNEQPEPLMTQEGKMESSPARCILKENNKTVSSPHVINTDFKDSPKDRNVPLDIDKTFDENVRDELNNSNSESTTKVLSKALNALVRQDMDTVTPPRKAKTKTPVKKKTNLFRPYDLEDKKKVPTVSPVLLRANYGGRNPTDSWQIEKRSKAETVMPYIQSNGMVVNGSKNITDLENENPFGLPSTINTYTKDTVTGIVNGNLSGVQAGHGTRYLKPNETSPITSYSHLPLLSSTPKRPPSLSVVKNTISSDLKVNGVSARQDRMEIALGKHMTKDVDNSESNNKVMEQSDVNQGHVPKVSASEQLDNMCQKISAVMGRLAEGFRNQKHHDNLGHTVAEKTAGSTATSQNEVPSTTPNQVLAAAPNQTPIAAPTRAPVTTIAELPRPGSCPPRMVNPATTDISCNRNGLQSGSQLVSADSMIQSWAKHHSTTAGILSTSDSGKTVLPSFATFTNKRFHPSFQPQPPSVTGNVPSKERQPTSDLYLGKTSSSQLVQFPRNTIYPQDLSSQGSEIVNRRVKTEAKDNVPNVNAYPYGLKRPLPFLDADAYVSDNKIPKMQDSNVEKVNTQRVDEEVRAMHIPLRPPLPSPQTRLVTDTYLSSHRHLAGKYLPFSVPSSHMNKTFTAPFQSSQVYTSSLNMHKMHSIYSDTKKDFGNEATVEDVRKKLDLNFESGKANIPNDATKSYISSNKFPVSVYDKNLKNLQERVITNSEETKRVDYPKYIVSDTQKSAFGEVLPRYDIENVSSYAFMSNVEKQNNIHSPSLNRRPLGVSVLQNQMLGQRQRYDDPRIESPVPDNRPKPFSVRKPTEPTYPTESKHPVHHYPPSDPLMRSTTPAYVPGPFTTPVRPLRQSPFTPVPTMKPPTPTFGSQYRPMPGQVEPLSPVPVADKIPMAALLLMMKVNSNL